jgi:methionyl-tRNA formyltransferase
MPDKLVFAGTPEFALASLVTLIEHGLTPALVLTQPDRPAGRGRRLKSGPVKAVAEEHGIPVRQPETLKNPRLEAELRELGPRAIVVAAYGLLFPRSLLDLPERGCINVHASLLPRWRGAAPIEAAILAGDAETGVSLMQMEEGLDTGGVFAQARLAIGETETAGALHDRLASLGGKLLVTHLPDILTGRLQATPQDESQATRAGKRCKEDARLDWRLSALQLSRRVRAFNPVPGAWFELDGEIVKCWRAEPLPGRAAPPGTVLTAGAGGIEVACGDGALRLLELQRPSRRRVAAAEFARQRPLSGRRLGVSSAT